MLLSSAPINSKPYLMFHAHGPSWIGGCLALIKTLLLFPIVQVYCLICFFLSCWCLASLVVKKNVWVKKFKFNVSSKWSVILKIKGVEMTNGEKFALKFVNYLNKDRFVKMCWAINERYVCCLHLQRTK